MNHLITIIGLAVSSNLDTLGIGFAYGTRKYRLPLLSNLICAAIPSAGTYLTMVLGTALRNVIPTKLSGILGAAIIIAAGVVLIIQYRKTHRRSNHQENESTEPGAAEQSANLSARFTLKALEYQGRITTREATVLAFALTLNNLSAGFAAGLMGLSVTWLVGLSFVFSLILFSAGIKIGVF